MNRWVLVPVVLGLWLAPSLAAAQDRPQPSWGVSGTFVPEWKIPSSLEPLGVPIFSEDELAIADQDLHGDEFRVGIVRGRPLGGEWGVSFVRRRYADVTAEGSNGSGFRSTGAVYETSLSTERVSRTDVELTGIEAHKFVGFVTIANRVQVGLNVAGGIGKPSGLVDVASFVTTTRCRNPSFVLPTTAGPDIPDPCTGPGATVLSQSTVQTGAASREAYPGLFKNSVVPIGRVELGVGVAVVRQFTVRLAGGLNYPGTNNITVTGIYYFGAQ